MPTSPKPPRTSNTECPTPAKSKRVGLGGGRGDPEGTAPSPNELHAPGSRGKPGAAALQSAISRKGRAAPPASTIAVRKRLDSEKFGMCNACGPDLVVVGGATASCPAAAPVLEVRMKGLAFRLCEGCASRLKLAL